MLKLLHRFDLWLDTHKSLLLLLLLVIVLRLPTFSEPYWYGDEGIYLTIGNALRDGQRLYSDIIDHKTPLIYYLAMTPSQSLFRLLLVGWMLVSTTAFFQLAKQLTAKNWLAIFGTTIFVVGTSLPWWEGHIPNGELFVMGWILLASYVLTKTQLFSQFANQRQTTHTALIERTLLTGVGFLSGLGVLTKVPALFDTAALASLIWLVAIDQLRAGTNTTTIRRLVATSYKLIWIGLGLIIPIVLSILYFALRGSLSEYIQFGLLYNFRYAAHWQLPFTAPWLLPLFTLPGKAILSTILILLLTWQQQRLTPALKLGFIWTVLGLFGATLSNRPYPHYLLQVVPGLALLLTGWCETLATKRHRKKLPSQLVASSFSLVGLSLVFCVIRLLKFGHYPVISYYYDWAQHLTGQLTTQEYYSHYNSLMTDNYQAAQIIKQSGTSKLFIWGTNPMLYALSGTYPTGRFTVSFHIKDFQAYQETLASVVEIQPPFIIVMNNEPDPLPGLATLLDQHYVPNQNFSHFVLWKSQSFQNE